VRDFLRSVLVGACGLPAVLLAAAVTAAPATASTVPANDVGPQRSATPNVTAEIAYARAQVHPGDQDAMTVSLVNHGPQSLDDHTSVHVTVTMPQEADVSPNVLETIPGNAPTGSSNAVPSTRSVPLTQVFVRSAPGFFDVVVPAGSFGNSTSFRTYTFALHIPSNAPQGAQLIGGGVAVALENYVGLTVVKSIVQPPPVVVVVPKAPSKPHKSGGAPGVPGSKPSGSSSKPSKPVASGKPGGSGGWGVTGAGSSEWIQRWGTAGRSSCPGGSMSGGAASGGASSGGTASGGAASGGASSGGMSSGGTSGGLGTCPCPVDQHMSAPGGGTGGGSSCCGGSAGGSGGESNGCCSGGGSGGPVMCVCPVNPHMGMPSGGAGGSSGGSGNSGSGNGGGSGNNGGSGSGTHCTSAGLAATGTVPTWPVAIGVLALVGGVVLMRVARGRNWSRP
jgi:hypothetical protein